MTINFLVTTYPQITWLFVGIFGACMGSFAALIIHRWPQNISIVKPRSFCQNCGKLLKPWHNIPIISWLFLNGRCANCRTFYGFRPLIIEIIFTLLALALFAKFGLSLALIEKFLFVFLLICLAYIDLDSYFLPLSMLGLLALWGLLFTVFYYFYPSSYVPMGEAHGLLKYLVLKVPLGVIPDRFAGGLAGLLFFSFINLSATWILRTSQKLKSEQWAMGWGDPLLLMAIGLFVGLTHLVLVIFLASATGALCGLALKIFKTPQFNTHNDENIAPSALPYGPFLALAAIYVYLF